MNYLWKKSKMLDRHFYQLPSLLIVVNFPDFLICLYSSQQNHSKHGSANCCKGHDRYV